MRAVGMWVLTRVGRAVGATAGMLTLLALQPEPVRPVEVTPATTAPGVVVARSLILSDQARRYLSLHYRAYPTEFLGCMIGEVQGESVVVDRIAPADVDPAQSTATHVVPRQSCEGAGWTGTVGVVHSHPSGERCWYYFPGTQVATSDGQSFVRQPYPVDAIMCGDKVVWIARDLRQHQIRLGVEKPAPTPQARGNRVHAGSGPVTTGGRD